MSNTLIDMTGQKFGRLTVISRAENTSEGRAQWLCKCDCGNTKIVLGKRLRNGGTKSCGCLQKERTSQACLNDITGQRFHSLVVLERVPGRFSGKVKWKCQCDCGSIIEVTTSDLVTNHTKSCGCTKSFGEKKISKILTDNNILFKKEYTFKDCYQIENHPYKFDFGILDENQSLLYLIEYDGSQHFISNGGWNTPENFEKRKQQDIFKNNYCKKNNIPLIRIPYTILDNLCIEDLLLSKTKYLI